MTLSNSRKPTHCVQREQYEAFLNAFYPRAVSLLSGYEPSFGKMIWSSILAVLTHNVALLPTCSVLSADRINSTMWAWFLLCGFFFLSPYLLCLNVRLSGGKQGLQAASLQSRFIFGMTRFPLKIERLIYWAFSSHDCTIWILWCLIKVPLHNTAAFITSNSNVSYSAGVLRVSVLLLSKWRGESLELQKTVSVYEFNQIVNVSWYMILIKVHMDFRD